jgi:excisionase family DNA binding protein
MSFGRYGSAAEFLTVDEAADFLRVSRATVYRLLRANELPGAFRMGGLGGAGAWRIDKSTFEQWIANLSRNGGVLGICERTPPGSEHGLTRPLKKKRRS